MTPRVAVLGMGNVLMGDDGAGPYTIATLTACYQLPAEVIALDIGTPGLDLVPYLSDVDTLILVDTVYSDAPAGAIRTYDQDALLSQKVPPRLSPHDPAVGQCLAMLEIEGKAPRETVLVGIVPKSSALGPGLSPDVQAAIPFAMDRVVRELESRGLHVPLRESPLKPDLWWEA
jgi:hydrogenase maturation protease